MDWHLVKEIAAECEAFSLASDESYPPPDFSKEQLCWCIAEMAVVIRNANRALMQEVLRASQATSRRRAALGQSAGEALEPKCNCPEVCKVCGGRTSACAILGHRPESQLSVEWHECPTALRKPKPDRLTSTYGSARTDIPSNPC